MKMIGIIRYNPLTILMTVTLAASVVHAQAIDVLSNGSFEADPSSCSATLLCDWEWIGDIDRIEIDGDGNVAVGGGNHVASIGEEDAGGISMLWQEFDLALLSGQTTLSYVYFRYRIDATGVPVTDFAVPPDAFHIFLVDEYGERFSLLGDPSSTVLTQTQAVHYRDRDGEYAWPSALSTSSITNPIVINGPDADGFLNVAINTSVLTPNDPARIEFGLACADNGVDTTVLIDGVWAECDWNDIDGDRFCEFCPTDSGGTDKPSSISMVYIGGGCDQTSTFMVNDAESGYVCEGSSVLSDPAYIIVCNKAERNKWCSATHVYFSGYVAVGEMFTASTSDGDDFNGKGGFGVHIFNTCPPPIVTYGLTCDPEYSDQMISIHTSCSEPLLFGDIYGAVLIMDIKRKSETYQY